jgi:hypothetical protein
MASLMNGLSALGQGVSAFAGTAGLELQKSQLANQSAVLADQLATVRETTLQGQQQNFQSGENTKSQAATAANTATVEAGANTRNTASIAGTAANTAATVAGEAARNTESQAGAMARTQLEVEKPTGELQMARALAGPGATQEQLQEALTTVLSGRAKYSFSPTTQVDPDDPNKVISGVNRQNTRTGDVDFLPTGTNPNKPGAAGGALGNRAEVYFKRVAVAANEAAAAAQNIMELPSGSDSGWFAGRGHPNGLLGAAKESLVNAVTSQGVQDYNTIVPGIARSLATIETGGLATNGSLTGSMDSLTLKAGDSEITKMRKMAELRQIVEKGMEPNLVDPKIPEVQKEQIRGIITQIQTAIPFTHHDITVLQKSDNPNQTMADVVKARGIGGSSPASATTAPAAAAIPSWVKPGDQYSPSRGQARGADGAIYGAPQ